MAASKDVTVDAIDAGEKLGVNPGNENEYMLSTTLAENDEIKVVHLTNNVIDAWYPDGEDTQYHVDAAHAGCVNIYFQTTCNNAWSEFGGYFYIEAASTYTVTVNCGTGGGSYYEGASVTITANEPEDGMIFTGWTGANDLTFTEGDATTATATFTMPAGDVTVTASFTAYWYILQEQFNDPGTDNVRMIANAIAPDGAGHMIIPAGKNVTLDLNGHTLNTKSKTFASYSDLTLKDTSSEMSGTVTGTGTYVIHIISR